jgi:hypothetical protein
MPKTAATLIRQRLTGAKPYKVPPEDGRRARYAIPEIIVSEEQFQVIKTVVETSCSVTVRETLRVFRVQEKSPQ